MFFFIASCLSVPSKESCSLCKKAIRKGADNSTSNLISRLCRYDSRCESTYYAAMQRQARNPTYYCGQLGYCRNTAEALSIKPKRTRIVSELHESTDNCQYCCNLFDYLTGEGLQEQTIPVFRELIKAVCGDLSTASAICDQVNDHHIDTLVKLIAAKFENTELCTQAGFCQ